jgi:DNA-binding XRE family transcriptional regulator
MTLGPPLSRLRAARVTTCPPRGVLSAFWALNMPTLAAYPGMMQRARKREGLRVCRAAWLVGVSVREYREIEAGDRTPSLHAYQRLSEQNGWPQTFVGRPTEGRSR